MVRRILSEKDFVRSFSNADEFSGGGSGATVVKFTAMEDQ
jgi:dsDNA-specific endonuclease/ATPase MutS2